MTEPQTQTIGWECSFHCVIEPHVWTRRCEQYIVGTDITVVMVAGDFVFQGWPSTDNTLHRAGKHLQLHDAIMVPGLFAKGSWGVTTFSTHSAEHRNINRMACVNVRGNGIRLQNFITYHAVKNKAFDMVLTYVSVKGRFRKLTRTMWQKMIQTNHKKELKIGQKTEKDLDKNMMLEPKREWIRAERTFGGGAEGNYNWQTDGRWSRWTTRRSWNWR